MINIKGIDLDQPVVTSCMTGMSATIAAGVLHVLGKDAAVYYVSFFILAENPEYDQEMPHAQVTDTETSCQMLVLICVTSKVV